MVEDEPKNHLFWRSLFSPRRLCEQAELSYLRVRESARHGEADASTTSDCLVWFLIRRHHWAIFLRKWARSCRHCQWRSLPRHAKRILVYQIWRGGHKRHFNRTAHLVTQRYNRSFAHCLRSHRIISQNADVNWPPRSCELTPLGYFLWRAVKGKCYANQPETIQELNMKSKLPSWWNTGPYSGKCTEKLGL